MAVLDFGTNDVSTVKLWSKSTEIEVLPKTLVGKFIGSGSGSVIQMQDDMKKSAGDRVRMNLQYLLSARGRQGNEVLEGNEEAPVFKTDDLVIDQIRNAVRWYGRMDKQRVVYDFRRDSRDQLSNWFADRLDTCFLNQVCGNTAQTDTAYTGNNATVAPSSNNILYAGSATTAATLTSADTFDLSLVDKAVTRAKTLHHVYDQPIIRPVKDSGSDYFVMILHPHQVKDMRANTSTGQWLDIQKAAMQGGAISDNPIFSGALGVYNGVIFYESPRIPLASDSTTAAPSTRAAVLLGAQAGWLAYGREGGSAERYLWNEETFDFGNEHGIAASLIFGMKKAIFDSKDHGAIVVSTYAAE
jgi:N4-gp56 family major capsid protein